MPKERDGDEVLYEQRATESLEFLASSCERIAAALERLPSKRELLACTALWGDTVCERELRKALMRADSIISACKEPKP
jgi:hypothetical protein